MTKMLPVVRADPEQNHHRTNTPLTMHGREVQLPRDGGARPERAFLEWHNENRFVA